MRPDGSSDLRAGAGDQHPRAHAKEPLNPAPQHHPAGSLPRPGEVSRPQDAKSAPRGFWQRWWPSSGHSAALLLARSPMPRARAMPPASAPSALVDPPPFQLFCSRLRGIVSFLSAKKHGGSRALPPPSPTQLPELQLGIDQSRTNPATVPPGAWTGFVLFSNHQHQSPVRRAQVPLHRFQTPTPCPGSSQLRQERPRGSCPSCFSPAWKRTQSSPALCLVPGARARGARGGAALGAGKSCLEATPLPAG